MDETTSKLLDLLIEKMGEEPEFPDLEIHTGSHLELVSRRYNEWERGVYGLRSLVGVRLLNEAIEDRRGRE